MGGGPASGFFPVSCILSARLLEVEEFKINIYKKNQRDAAWQYVYF